MSSPFASTNISRHHRVTRTHGIVLAYENSWRFTNGTHIWATLFKKGKTLPLSCWWYRAANIVCQQGHTFHILCRGGGNTSTAPSSVYLLQYKSFTPSPCNLYSCPCTHMREFPTAPWDTWARQFKTWKEKQAFPLRCYCYRAAKPGSHSNHISQITQPWRGSSMATRSSRTVTNQLFIHTITSRHAPKPLWSHVRGFDGSMGHMSDAIQKNKPFLLSCYLYRTVRTVSQQGHIFRILGGASRRRRSTTTWFAKSFAPPPDNTYSCPCTHVWEFLTTQKDTWPIRLKKGKAFSFELLLVQSTNTFLILHPWRGTSTAACCATTCFNKSMYTLPHRLVLTSQYALTYLYSHMRVPDNWMGHMSDTIQKRQSNLLSVVTATEQPSQTAIQITYSKISVGEETRCEQEDRGQQLQQVYAPSPEQHVLKPLYSGVRVYVDLTGHLRNTIQKKMAKYFPLAAVCLKCDCLGPRYDIGQNNVHHGMTRFDTPWSFEHAFHVFGRRWMFWALYCCIRDVLWRARQSHEKTTCAT